MVWYARNACCFAAAEVGGSFCNWKSTVSFDFPIVFTCKSCLSLSSDVDLVFWVPLYKWKTNSSTVCETLSWFGLFSKLSQDI